MKVILTNSTKILSWMRANAKDHIDPKTGELNCTALVEAWDAAEGTGKETLQHSHPAWDLAVEIAEELEG